MNVDIRAKKRIYTFDTVKFGPIEGIIINAARCVDFTKIPLHTKFQRNLSRNEAIRNLKK